MAITIGLAIIIIVSAATALLARNLIRAAIALGLSSAALAMLFFTLGAPYAGGFELSVGVGLISVLFIVTVSVTQARHGGEDEA